MNPISNPNASHQVLDPFMLPVPNSINNPYLENPNQAASFSTPYPFVDYVPSPLPPLMPTYTTTSSYDTSHHNFPTFPYSLHMDSPFSNTVKREDGNINNMGIGVGIGLNLGQRTYFNTTRGLFGFGPYGPGGPTVNPPRCQVDGCKTDLTGAKHYHRRHKVCEFHSKAPVVVVGGMQERFCQQCSRFHVVGEFDEAKRSCRKRLADHNRRRRKPQFPSKKETDQGSHKLKSSSSTSSAHNKPTNDTSSAVTNNSTPSMSSTSCNNIEGSCAQAASDRQQAIDKLNSGTTTLSLGEVARLDSAFSNQSLDIYHHHEPSFAAAARLDHQEKHQSYYHHHHQQQQQQQNSSAFGSSSSSNKGQALFNCFK